MITYCFVFAEAPLAECTFELALSTEALCVFYVAGDGSWMPHVGPTPTQLTGPQTDHTTLTDRGKLAEEMKSVTKKKKKKRIVFS